MDLEQLLTLINWLMIIGTAVIIIEIILTDR